MGLNKAKGNMYGFVTDTWNTVKGICPHGCSYCYMKRRPQYPIRFDKSELKTDLGEGKYIFVGSSCDMWAYEIPDVWIADTLNHCKKYKNQYLFQTKYPQRFKDYFGVFENEIDCSLCITLETNRYYPCMGRVTIPKWRADIFSKERLYFQPKVITIEPILDFDFDVFVEMIKRCDPAQVNIGADSGGNKLPEPDGKKVLELIEALRGFTNVHCKPNLKRLVSLSDMYKHINY